MNIVTKPVKIWHLVIAFLSATFPLRAETNVISSIYIEQANLNKYDPETVLFAQYCHELIQQETVSAIDKFGFPAHLKWAREMNQSHDYSIHNRINSAGVEMVYEAGLDSLRVTFEESPFVIRWMERLNMSFIPRITIWSIGAVNEENLSVVSPTYSLNTSLWIEEAQKQTWLKYGFRPWEGNVYTSARLGSKNNPVLLMDARYKFELGPGKMEVGATLPFSKNFRLVSGASSEMSAIDSGISWSVRIEGVTGDNFLEKVAYVGFQGNSEKSDKLLAMGIRIPW